MVSASAAPATPTATAAAHSRARPRTASAVHGGQLPAPAHAPSRRTATRDAARRLEGQRRHRLRPARSTSSRRSVSPSIAHTQRSAGQPGAHSSTGERALRVDDGEARSGPSRRGRPPPPRRPAPRSGQATTAPAAMPGRSAAGQPAGIGGGQRLEDDDLGEHAGADAAERLGQVEAAEREAVEHVEHRRRASARPPRASRTFGASSLRPSRSAARRSSSTSGVELEATHARTIAVPRIGRRRGGLEL